MFGYCTVIGIDAAYCNAPSRTVSQSLLFYQSIFLFSARHWASFLGVALRSHSVRCMITTDMVIVSLLHGVFLHGKEDEQTDKHDMVRIRRGQNGVAGPTSPRQR